MQIHLRKIVSGETMGWAEYDEILRRVWERISGEKTERSDLLFFLREKSAMDQQTAERALEQRTDALRAVGNGVVSLCGAVAFVELVRRLQR